MRTMLNVTNDLKFRSRTSKRCVEALALGRLPLEGLRIGICHLGWGNIDDQRVLCSITKNKRIGVLVGWMLTDKVPYSAQNSKGDKYHRGVIFPNQMSKTIQWKKIVKNNSIRFSQHEMGRERE